MLTAAAGMAGETDIAAEALQGLRRTQPDVTLAWSRSSSRSGTKTNASIFLKVCAAPAWSSPQRFARRALPPLSWPNQKPGQAMKRRDLMKLLAQADDVIE